MDVHSLVLPGEIPTTGRGIGHTPPVALNEDQAICRIGRGLMDRVRLQGILEAIASNLLAATRDGIFMYFHSYCHLEESDSIGWPCLEPSATRPSTVTRPP